MMGALALGYGPKVAVARRVLHWWARFRTPRTPPANVSAYEFARMDL